jgi:2-polyprenyl-6-methoxyphenol hydroxylase-like FAD-dependent oxidoreductase
MRLSRYLRGTAFLARGPQGTRRAYRARYAVGTDGVRSTVRRLLGIPFPGDTVLSSVIIGDVLMKEAGRPSRPARAAC